MIGKVRGEEDRNCWLSRKSRKALDTKKETSTSEREAKRGMTQLEPGKLLLYQLSGRMKGNLPRLETAEQGSRVGAELWRMNTSPTSLAGRMVQRNCHGGCKRARGWCEKLRFPWKNKTLYLQVRFLRDRWGVAEKGIKDRAWLSFHGRWEEADDKYVPVDTLQQREKTTGQTEKAKGKQEFMKKSEAGAVKDNQHIKAKAEEFLSLGRKSLLHPWKSHFRAV